MSNERDLRMLSELSDQGGNFPEIYQIDPSEPTRHPKVIKFYEKKSNFKGRWLFADFEVTMADGSTVVKAAEVRGRREFDGDAELNRYVASVSKTFSSGNSVTAGTPKWYIRQAVAKRERKKKGEA